MSELKRRVEGLTVDELKAFPVWQYTNADEDFGETVVRPVKKTPVENLSGRLVGTQVTLANGTDVWAIIGNVDSSDPRLTRHFLTLSALKDEHWFTMARYHDLDSVERGPDALAAFLSLRIDEIFPISYDVSRHCKGELAALRGTIEKAPRETLTRAELVALAVP